MRILSVCLTILLLNSVSIALAAENELQIGKFSTGSLDGWKAQTIWNSKKTSYSFVPKNGSKALMGKSSNSASGLINKIEIDPKLYPFIKWSWKIDHTVRNGNEKVKEGHDFAARLYVVFSRGFFFRTRAIEYVWGNVMRKGESMRSPYSNNVVMIAVDSGDESAGQWISHKRNFYEDYRTAFGEEAPKVGAIAIMTDSDNTRENSVGYYGDISLISAAKEEESKTRETKTREAVPKEQPHKDNHQKETEPKGPPNNNPPVTTPNMPPAPAQSLP